MKSIFNKILVKKVFLDALLFKICSVFVDKNCSTYF